MDVGSIWFVVCGGLLVGVGVGGLVVYAGICNHTDILILSA